MKVILLGVFFFYKFLCDIINQYNLLNLNWLLSIHSFNKDVMFFLDIFHTTCYLFDKKFASSYFLKYICTDLTLKNNFSTFT